MAPTCSSTRTTSTPPGSRSIPSRRELGVHLTLTPCTNESRLLREAGELLSRGVLREVETFALWEPGLALTEGRNRQIRRVCDLVGLSIIDLYRLRIGPLKVGDLPEGRWRALDAGDLSRLFDTALLPFLLEPIALEREAYQDDNLQIARWRNQAGLVSSLDT